MFFHRRPLLRAVYSIPVLLILALIWGIWYSFFKGYMMLVPATSGNIFLYTIFHILVLLLLWCYWNTVAVDPGTLPPNFDLESIRDRQELIENEEIL